MRILFVWLNSDAPVGYSHGLAVLSAELKAAGHSVSLLHVNEQLGLAFDLERIGEKLEQRAPDLVGLSFGTNHAALAALLATEAKKRLPDAWIVAGGIHATLYPDQVMSWPAVDIAALGEVDGDRFTEVVEALSQGRLPEHRPGFWFRHCGRVVKNPLGPPVDLDGSRPVDLELFDHASILEHKRGWADVHSGRGCPMRCSYCHNEPLRRAYLGAPGCGTSYVRRRPLGVVLEELARYRQLYGERIRVFSFTDDQFVLGRRWLFEFLEAYSASCRIPLVFLSSAAAIDAEVAERCARAGVYMVRIGVESGSARVRREILRRPTPAAAIRQAVTALQRAGVNAFAFQMLGIPGETPRDLAATFRFGAALGCDAHKFSMFWPYPGTELFEHCLSQGLVRPGLDFVGNNGMDSPLVWPPERQRFFRRIPRFYDVALNRFLPTSQRRHYQKLMQELLMLTDAAWQAGGGEELRRRADGINQATIERGELAYAAPFADRPDVVLLTGKARTRPLLA
jgi:anaerobic magnesium-protoporphyrin IX monomethyl ester cyclase